jgi:hypothetical protein
MGVAWIAWVNGFLGAASAWLVGTRVLGLEDVEALRCVGASNAAGMAALLVTMQAERTVWVRRRLLTRGLYTWVLFLSTYFGMLLALAPALRSGRTFLILIFPVILSTGFTILAFGPIQDRIVARQQRRRVLG